MKMSLIQPQVVTQAAAQSREEMLFGLSWLGATPEDIATSLTGVGSLAGFRGSVMDAIISNAVEMNKKMATVDKERLKVAKKEPQFAMKLSAAIKKTSVPGTNVAAGVKAASDEAARKAMKAKQEESRAQKLLMQNDKRGAAATAVQALTTAREAAILSNSAEKTRLATSLDSVAHTLESQALYVEGAMVYDIGRQGPSRHSDALRAKGQALRSQAQKLRATSAVVAAAPVVPPQAPTQKRIAEVANKFNIRAVGRGTDANVISVLSDLTEDALAQVRDYDGALKFYGDDAVGRLMCDMEFDNKQAALKGLAQSIHGMGYVDTLPVLAQADKVLAQGVAAAQKGYVDAVLPAYAGQGSGLRQMQKTAMQLSGLSGIGDIGALGGVWEDWCDQNVPGGKTGSAAKYNGDVAKCKNPKGNPPSLFNFFVFAPWDQLGLVERGVQTVGDAAAIVGGDLMAGKDVITGGAPKPAAQTPPPATRPPLTVPGGATKSDPFAYSYGGGSSGSYAKKSNTVLYAGIGAGALLLGAAAYWTMFRRPTAS